LQFMGDFRPLIYAEKRCNRVFQRDFFSSTS
jgi:hypothetical protein